MTTFSYQTSKNPKLPYDLRIPPRAKHIIAGELKHDATLAADIDVNRFGRRFRAHFSAVKEHFVAEKVFFHDTEAALGAGLIALRKPDGRAEAVCLTGELVQEVGFALTSDSMAEIAATQNQHVTLGCQVHGGVVTTFPNVAEAAQLRDALACDGIALEWERLWSRERRTLVADTQKHVVMLRERLACETAIREAKTSTRPHIVDGLLAAKADKRPRDADSRCLVPLVEEHDRCGSIGQRLVVDLDAVV